MISLVRYDAACRALAKARTVDEVKVIRNKAIAIKAYAKQAKNKELEADAWEIRKRAERRLGEIMAELPKNPGVRVGVGYRRVKKKPADPPTLLDSEIDKNLANRARMTRSMPRREFEEMVRRGREEIYRSADAPRPRRRLGRRSTAGSPRAPRPTRPTARLVHAERAKPGNHKRFSKNPLPTLADVGLDKNLADRARRARAMPRDVRMGKRGFYVGRGPSQS
jgi:hypothetical protein